MTANRNSSCVWVCVHAGICVQSQTPCPVNCFLFLPSSFGFLFFLLMQFFMFHRGPGCSFDFVFCIFGIDIIIVILGCQSDYIWNELKQAPGQPVRNFPDWIVRSRKIQPRQKDMKTFCFCLLTLVLTGKFIYVVAAAFLSWHQNQLQCRHWVFEYPI